MLQIEVAGLRKDEAALKSTQSMVGTGVKKLGLELQQEQARLKAASADLFEGVEEARRMAVLEDVGDWQERLATMKVQMSKSHVKQCSKKLDLVKEVMGRVQLAPNNNQFAIAAHASYHVGLRGRTKLLYSVPPGMGKSRVASTLMYLCQNLERIKHIRYYYTHRKLQNVDSQALQELKIVMPGVELSTQCVEARHETIAAGNDTLVILDEADDIIVDKDTAIEAHNVVGLTATASSDAIFKGQIASLKWEVVDSKIPSQLNESCPYEKAESVKDFMVATAGRPRLVFGDEDVRKQLEAFAGANGLRLHHNLDDVDRIKAL